MLIDTAQAIRRLREAGADEKLANAIVDLWRMASQAALTRADVQASETALRQDIELLRADLSREIELVRTDLSMEIDLVRAELTTEIRRAQLETTRNVRAWVAGGVGVIALLMALFEFIA